MKNLFISIMLLATQVVRAELKVHEWGTFTSLVGSDGRPQDAMYYDDEELPSFVHNFGDEPLVNFFSSNSGRSLLAEAGSEPVPPKPNPPSGPCDSKWRKVPCRFLEGNTITQKMETPVVYFYSDKPQKVSFKVDFPGGIISQDYPAAVHSAPAAIPGVELRNGHAEYQIEVLKHKLPLPHVEPGNIYGHARNVASDLIRSGSETEKFIFYRGLGDFNSQLKVRSQHGFLSFTNSGQKDIPAVFLIHTDGVSHGQIFEVGSVLANKPNNKAKIPPLLVPASVVLDETRRLSFDVFLQKARTLLHAELVKAGLYSDEATAMVDTWEHGYFRTAGLKVLYVLNREEVDLVLPIQVSPVPEELERAFVGRLEILTDTRENELLSEIVTKGRSFDVQKLGRIKHSILLRLREIAVASSVLSPQVVQDIDYLIGQL